MKKYLFLCALSTNFLYSINFLQTLELECACTRAKNRVRRLIAAQRDITAALGESQIPEADLNIIKSRFGLSASVRKVSSMGNEKFSAYFVGYIDELHRRRNDYINCIENNDGSKKLAVISINVMS